MPQLIAGARSYTVVPDLVSTTGLVLTAQVVDAATGRPVRQPLSVTISRPDLHVKTRGAGLLAVAADATLAFPHLATDPYDLELAIRAAGYAQLTIPVHLAAGTTLPLPPLSLELRRLPVQLRGRVVTAAGDHDPIAGARITVAAADTLALATPLYLAHAAGTEVTAVTLTPQPAVKQTTAPVRAGQVVLPLSNRLGLAPGDILQLGPAHRRELAIIDELAPLPADPAEPGQVTLRAPLHHSLAFAEQVAAVSVASGDSTSLSQGQEPGEAILPLFGELSAAAVRIEAAASPLVAYHAVGAVTDGNGYYRLDGVSVVAATYLASAAGFTNLVKPWTTNHHAATNVLDFRLESE